MPQLTIETFFSQYFWLVTFLFCFYYFIMMFFIPNMSNILKTRSKLSGVSDEQLVSSQDEAVLISKNILTTVSQAPNPFKGEIKSWTKKKKSSKPAKVASVKTKAIKETVIAKKGKKK